jgi:acyl transferase domain-containing protein
MKIAWLWERVLMIFAARVCLCCGLPAGPSVSTDTACSSSLVSAHQAHKGLLAGETVAALAAGVNTMLLPITTTSIAGLGALSPDARCKTFDASADGYGRGEGFGVVVLAPAAGKQQAGTVLALVCGSAVNQDGRSSGLTAPNGPSQTALVRDVLASGSLAGADVGYVATHGTGGQAACQHMGCFGRVHTRLNSFCT